MNVPEGTTPVIFFVRGGKAEAAEWASVVSVVLQGLTGILDKLGPHEAENLRRIRGLWPDTVETQIGVERE